MIHKPGSKRRLSRDNTTTSTITDRKIYAIVDQKHSLVFHKDGYIMLFMRKRTAQDFLDDPDIPKDWRPIRIKIHIEKDYEK